MVLEPLSMARPLVTLLLIIEECLQGIHNCITLKCTLNKTNASLQRKMIPYAAAVSKAIGKKKEQTRHAHTMGTPAMPTGVKVCYA